MSDSAVRLRKLKILRNNCINEVAVLVSLGTRAKDDRSVKTLFKVRCSELDVIKEDFLKHHASILSAILSENASAEVDGENTIREGFLDDFYQVKAFYSEMFEGENHSTVSLNINQSANHASNNCSQGRLPKIEIPKFKGDFKTFKTFIDLFNALVHDNASLSDIEKFNYLLASLEGQPLNLVRTLPMTHENYSIAYDTFVKRYSNKRLRANAHWNAIESVGNIGSQNPRALRYLIDTFSENIAALKNLEFPTDHWDFILINMILKKLDSDLVTKFELQHGTVEIPTFNEIIEFLNKCCNAYDTLTVSNNHAQSFRKQGTSRSQSQPNRTSSFFANKMGNGVTSFKCVLCKEAHSLYNCPAFLTKNPRERYEYAKSVHLCLNCLSNVHKTPHCKSLKKCFKCDNFHHTLLHWVKAASIESNLESSPKPQSSMQTETPDCPSTQPSGQILSASGLVTKHATVLLSTALINVRDSKGSYQQARCLLDSGSMTSFITQKAVSRLGLIRENSAMEIKGLGSMSTIQATHGSVTFSFCSIDKKSPVLTTDAVVLDKICGNLPPTRIDIERWSDLCNLKLADPSFEAPGQIDILLGADVFPQIILNGHLPGNDNRPSALNTIFGFILIGKINQPHLTACQTYFCHTNDLESTLKRFWEIESVPVDHCSSPDDEICETHFLVNHSRAPNGRYIVSLPFRDKNPTFPGTRNLAVSRFFSLERRLLKQPDIYAQYSDFMREYLDLGHMELIKNPTVSLHMFYIPHHHVLRPESSSTKLRVVFNGSAKLPDSNSLNDTLLVGPKLQADIVTVLLQFRLHEFVLCADLKMMYRNILVEKSECDYQRIVWRFSPDEPLNDYRLLTVVYGLKPSPYLALRTLKQLVEDEGTSFPQASNSILHHTYVDDVCTGTSSREEAIRLRDELILLFKKGGFELRKWSSNEPSLLSSFPAEYLSQGSLTFDSDSENSCLKVLGLQWNPKFDTFCFSLSLFERPCTKRNMLSELARVFDPLGFLAPVTLFTKLLIQRLWMSGINWDDTPPAEIISLWDQYKSQLTCLSDVKIPRKLLFSDSKFTYELHVFCDASEKGYACVAYIRILLDEVHVSTNFVCAKTKVSPLKKLTIPRLELCAAVLAAKMTRFILATYKNLVIFRTICAWSDSQIVLSWILSPPHRWKTFVANRVAYIQEEITPSRWYHVCSENNPADIASRGALPLEFLKDTMWFNGPSFLRSFVASKAKKEYSPNLDPAPPELKIVEQGKTFTAFSGIQNFLDTLLEANSSLIICQRILAFVLRFLYNIRTPSKKYIGSLSPEELHSALTLLVKHTQTRYFSDEMSRKQFSKPLRKLNVFVDAEGLLRVGGRLRYSSLSYHAKHPLLLPQKSRLTTLLISFFHGKYLHAGLRSLHFLIAQKFWILSPKRAINSVISKCLSCWKTRPKPFEPFMADLPPHRISEVKAFTHTGVDFGGPFFITLSRHRGVKTCKAYLCLFVCLATKAIHLELATDLSSDTFLSALQRFIARRGRCVAMYSDCGTNFVGANKELQTMMKRAAEHERVVWHFNVPSAPHFGGLWESGIRAVKSHLSRIVGHQIFSYEEFYTLLTLIESVLNSRPLTPMSADTDDINALTPGHFLTTEPITAIPTPDLTTTPLNRLSRWQLLQRLHQDFWRRYRVEYLHTLQQRSKWLEKSENPQIGTLVLIKTENCPPLQWPLARITALRPGADGVVRVAELKTPNGTLHRPLVKLCPLPLN